MSFEEINTLKAKIQQLHKKRMELDIEIDALKEQLIDLQKAAFYDENAKQVDLEDVKQLGFLTHEKILTKKDSIEDRYNLFISLFAGRPDVHAKRFQSIKTGKTGYSPVCRNEFHKVFCSKGAQGKKKVKCIDCEHQDFPQISLTEFIAHIRGEKENCSDVLGAYPMDSDEMCSFIVADFDNEDDSEAVQFEKMKAEAIAFQKACIASNISAYLERSRSGNGLHVWIFFEEKIGVRKARKLCSGILTLAMVENSVLSFDSYDRLIPSQDTLITTSFGNLIALPLQGKAGKKGFSVFVDENLIPYPDQWEFLSKIKKVQLHEVDEFFNKYAQYGELGELVSNEDDGEDEKVEKPWEKKKAEVKLNKGDFNGKIEVISANMIHIEKGKLSTRALNKVKRLAAFQNPDFYKAQAKRWSTKDKPRIISTFEETENYISVPRGAINSLKTLLDGAGAEYHMSDRTTKGETLDVTFVGNLREEQKPAAEAMLSDNIGVLSATTAFGKTVIGAHLIAEKAVNALVLVHNQQLQKQWMEALDTFLVIKNEPPIRLTPTGRQVKMGKIGEYSGGKKQLTGLVDVVMIQSLYKNGEVKDFVKDYGLVLIDECHHVPAVSFEAVLKQANAKYVYGLTATPIRDDGHHAILFLQCGPIRYKVDAKKQAEKRPFEHFVIPRFTNVLTSSVHDENNMAQLLNDISGDIERNKLIASDIISAVKLGRNPIVLTERTEHVNVLAELLNGECDNVITLVGGMGAKEKRTINDRLETLGENEKFVIIATSKYAGEGFDFPRLDTLLLTLPISGKGRINQYTGRLHRLHEGKTDVVVYDYVDVNIPVLERMYYKRIKGYKSVGYKTISNLGSEKQDIELKNMIFDSGEYWELFKADCEMASKEIVISSPFLTNKRISSLVEVFSKKIIDNVIVTVLTRPIDAYKENRKQSTEHEMKRLLDVGIKVIQHPELHQRFAVIDKTIVWYGSVNLLGFVEKTENLMRFDEMEVASKLLEQYHGKLRGKGFEK